MVEIYTKKSEKTIDKIVYGLYNVSDYRVTMFAWGQLFLPGRYNGKAGAVALLTL